MRILIFVVLLFTGCSQPPCIAMCMKENQKIVKDKFLTKSELKINCEAYCNAPAIETKGFADGGNE